MAAEYLLGLVGILLPIAALSGWYFGRKEVGANSIRRVHGSGVPQDYFKGLNYLLNDRPDKAIEVFIKVLKVESETVETHLALGNLFRRRGEVDRAIRIHQNLIARPSLDKEQRALALLELGTDYMRSGLLDRAESLFKELISTRMHEQQVLRHLVDIYQQEQDWDAAHDYVQRLERVTGEDMRHVRAHYFCEKAQNSMDTGDRPDAFRLLGEALNEDRKCVRAQLLYADLSDAIGDNDSAIAHLKKIEHQDIDFLPEAIPRLVVSYRKRGQLDELSKYLARLSDLHLGITPVLVLAELTAKRIGLDAAKHHIVAELKRRPTIRGIDRLIEYSMVGASGEYREDLQLLKETTARLIEDKLSYKCGNCGFTGRSLHWQCPSCKLWSTVKPIHGIEGE
ncbi:MAG TPA: lipopolysaccharide assembly protein LapB [Gammaproteobacteria bacterium]|nr:lipopolysaccharide assembly protein LapB [Gammaproteobacteria bacterium]|tara:strand:- start:120 stop:1307 length:1188 start_codon:yes stop_codon:yes gene_type:complete